MLPKPKNDLALPCSAVTTSSLLTERSRASACRRCCGTRLVLLWSSNGLVGTPCDLCAGVWSVWRDANGAGHPEGFSEAGAVPETERGFCGREHSSMVAPARGEIPVLLLQSPAICLLLAVQANLLPWLAVYIRACRSVLTWGNFAPPFSSDNAKHGCVLCRLLHPNDCYGADTSRSSCSPRKHRPATLSEPSWWTPPWSSCCCSC